MKKNEGITLIALVITIIVLLILAGVTIAMLTGENGLLSRATSTTSAQKAAEAKERAALAVADVYAGVLQDFYVNNKTSGFTTTAPSGDSTYYTWDLTASIDSTTNKPTVTGTVTLTTAYADDKPAGTVENGSITWAAATTNP